jgi:secreted PhoX family phosphatase
MNKRKVELSRRGFLQAAAAVSAGFMGLRVAAQATQPAASGSASAGAVGYGALTRDPHGVLDLPEGFAYRVL